jgi:3-dehydroquinate synthase
MGIHVAELTVNLGPRSYKIFLGNGNLADLGGLCKSLDFGKSAAVITNPKISGLYAAAAESSLSSCGFNVTRVEIPDGESYKNSETLNHIYGALIDAGLDRKSFIVALGGGVVGDISGFAASTYLRGIPFVQVPTSLLAQVDSSVGGKTGINHHLGKNLIGTFYQPRLVLIDADTLLTLPQREYLSGLAEIVKYGIVCDADFFDFLFDNKEKLVNKDTETVLAAISNSCRLKASVVENDEMEAGIRAVLNYGHTFAHAVESLTSYGEFLHGEAVSIGMVRAALLSEEKGYSTVKDTARIINLLREFNLPTGLPDFPTQAYCEVMMRDKKVRDGGINFVFNKGIGRCIIERVNDWSFLLGHL